MELSCVFGIDCCTDRDQFSRNRVYGGNYRELINSDFIRFGDTRGTLKISGVFDAANSTGNVLIWQVKSAVEFSLDASAAFATAQGD